MPRDLRALIIDDESLARERLRSLLELEDDVEVVGEAAGGAEGIELLDRLAPDVVFLDIDMPHVDGFDVAAHVFPGATTAIVFVTAYDSYALRAFEASAVDYLLKPVDAPRLQRALDKVRGRTAWTGARAESGPLEALLEGVNRGGAPRDRVAVRTGSSYLIVRLADVVWIEADGKFIVLHTDRAAYRHRAAMSEFAGLLDPREFIRIHRSAIVSVARVTQLEPWGLGEFLFSLSNGKKLPSSRRYRQAVRDAFGV